MENLNQFIGKRVKVKSNDIEYVGTVKSIDGQQRKIVLKNILDHTNDKRLRSEKHFYGDQIQELKILDEVQDFSEEKTNRKKEKEEKTWMDASDQGSSLFQMGHLEPSMYLNGLDEQIDLLSLNSPPKALLIEKLDKSFLNACTDISEQKVVSMLVDGKTINRFGDISLLTIGTRHMVYLFDIHSLSGDAFAEGLLPIIEDPNILKICHDVRLISDCLQAKYHVQPVNIFDTQVADAFIYKNENGHFPERVSSLTNCVTKHLRLKEEALTIEKEKKNLVKENRKIWLSRPLCKKMQKLCAKEAMFLRELRTIMLQKLLADFLHGVDIYLKCIREQTDNAVKFHTNLNKLPTEFNKRFANETETRGKFQHGRRRDVRNQEEDYDGNSFPNPEAQSSAWHSGTKFSEQYEEKHGEIVESFGNKCSMIDSNKPLLRRTNSPKTEKVPTQTTAKSAAGGTSDNEMKQGKVKSTTPVKTTPVKTTPSNSKSYVQNFQQREKNYDEFQFSTSDSDDGAFSNSNDEFNRDEMEQLMEVELKRANNSDGSGQRRARIGESAIRMIKNNLEPSVRQMPPPPQLSYLSSSTASSVDMSEYPSLQESLDMQYSKSPKSNGVSPKTWGGKENNTNVLPKKTVSDIPKPRGRGGILKSLVQQQSRLKTPSPGFGEIASLSRTIEKDLGNKVYDFPSDEELLDTPHVVPAVSGTRIIGENVSVLKKFNR